MLGVVDDGVVPFSPPCVAAVAPGVVEEVLPDVDGVVDDVPLPLVVPVAPIEEVVELGVVLLVVSELVPVLDVVVLGVVGALLRLPEPVVVDGGVVAVVDELEEPVPLDPVVGAASLRLQALRERAAAMATAMAVTCIFIRKLLDR